MVYTAATNFATTMAECNDSASRILLVMPFLIGIVLVLISIPVLIIAARAPLRQRQSIVYRPNYLLALLLGVQVWGVVVFHVFPTIDFIVSLPAIILSLLIGCYSFHIQNPKSRILPFVKFMIALLILHMALAIFMLIITSRMFCLLDVAF